MATKVYDSPTTNIFALLADEHAGQSQAKKTASRASANKGPEQELTPKERAEAKAKEDEVRKKQREAATQKKKEEEERRNKALEFIEDTTGFAQQRHQRLKESRQQDRVETSSPKSNKGWGDDDKGKKPWPKGDNKGAGKGDAKTGAKGPNADKGDNKGPRVPGKVRTDGGQREQNKNLATGFKEGKNFKGEGKVNFKNEGGVAKGAKSYDKHSQGVTSRQFQPKKQGHGKANWDEDVPAGLSSAPVKEALASEALTGEVDGWGEATATTGAETASDAATATTDAAADQKKEGKDKDAKDKDFKKDDEDDEDKNKKTLEDYLRDQEEKKKALEAKVKALTPQTTVTEEEKNALQRKFTFIESPNAAKPEPPKATPAPKPAVATTPAPPAIATGFRVAGSRAGGRGGRFEGQRDNTGRTGQRKGGRGPQKILKGKNEFPVLGGAPTNTK